MHFTPGHYRTQIRTYLEHFYNCSLDGWLEPPPPENGAKQLSHRCRHITQPPINVTDIYQLFTYVDKMGEPQII